MSQPPNGRQQGPGNPVGPLGAAFAHLATDAPPTELSAQSVIDAARQQGQQSHQRHRWVLATGVAAAAIAVTTLIGVSVSQSGSGSDSSSAAPASSAAGGQALASTSSLPGAGPGQPAPGDQGGGGSAAQSEPELAPDENSETGGACADALSAAEQSIVRAALPGLAAGECLPPTDGLVAGTSFEGPSVTVTVTVTDGDDPCPGDAPCQPLDNHPGIFVMGLPVIPAPAPGATPVRTDSVTVTGAGDGRIVAVSVQPDEVGDQVPYSVDDLAVLVEELVVG